MDVEISIRAITVRIVGVERGLRGVRGKSN
jgi:hypothetical protein